MKSKCTLLLFFFLWFPLGALLPAAQPGLAIPLNVFEDQLQQHIKYDMRGPNKVGYIYIGDKQNEINQGTWLYVKKALDYYKKEKPIFIILELNTPGGEVYAAERISDALKEIDTQFDIPVVAFINNWAMSAGALIAYSCRFITIVKDASMGAAEPIIASQTGEMKEASEKVNSALRADFANRATFYDRNPLLAISMVDKDTILVLRDNKITKLENENQILPSDEVISPKGKLLTLNGEQLIHYGVADLLLPPTRLEPITEAEKEKGQWPAGKELLFQGPFFDKIPNATIDKFRLDWKGHFFAFLANPIVSSLLFLGMMLGFYLEISAPGHGIGGTLAVVCLFLIILSSFALEIGNVLELIFLVTGLLVILVELFVLPTFGLLGFIGIILFFIGLFGLMLPGAGAVSFEFDTKTLNAAGEAFFERLAWLSGTLLLAVVIMIALARYVLPSFAGFSRFVLTGHEQDASKGYIAGQSINQLPSPGSKGEVFATLRPAGKVIIEDKIYDAISPGNFIEKGTPIKVVYLDGSVIVVNRLEGEGASKA